MLGGQGLTDSSKVALLNANYMASRLSSYYNVRYTNGNGRVAHELLIDLADFEKSAGLKVTDFAKRLQVRTFMYHFEIRGVNYMFRTMASTLLHVPGPFLPAC